MNTNLFQLGEFTLHSGKKSNFKIECDNLTIEDLRTLALLVSQKIKFGYVTPIPRGGDQFAEVLKAYIDPSSEIELFVDDVYTTGLTMESALSQKKDTTNVRGLVIFARNKPPKWISAIFQMWS